MASTFTTCVHLTDLCNKERLRYLIVPGLFGVLTTTAVTVTQSPLDCRISLFGVPTTILTDLAKMFELPQFYEYTGLLVLGCFELQLTDHKPSDCPALLRRLSRCSWYPTTALAFWCSSFCSYVQGGFELFSSQNIPNCICPETSFAQIVIIHQNQARLSCPNSRQLCPQ